MKTDEMNLTVAELEELCRLYMDCKLSVVEEKELEYVLSQTTLTSPSIEEVRSLMGVHKYSRLSLKPASAKRDWNCWNWRLFSGIAASIAFILTVAFCLTSRQDSLHSTDSDPEYIAAYSNGRRLNEREAIETTTIAMAKADSLMNYASLVERANMQKANEIISETFNN